MVKKLRITQIKSGIGRINKQRKTLEALGITKMHQTVEHNDTPAIRGMVNAVSHLIKFEEFEAEETVAEEEKTAETEPVEETDAAESFEAEETAETEEPVETKEEENS